MRRRNASVLDGVCQRRLFADLQSQAMLDIWQRLPEVRQRDEHEEGLCFSCSLQTLAHRMGR